jgi:hypothetical protein
MSQMGFAVARGSFSRWYWRKGGLISSGGTHHRERSEKSILDTLSTVKPQHEIIHDIYTALLLPSECRGDVSVHSQEQYCAGCDTPGQVIPAQQAQTLPSCIHSELDWLPYLSCDISVNNWSLARVFCHSRETRKHGLCAAWWVDQH